MVDVKKAVAVAIILMVMVIAGFTLFDNSAASDNDRKGNQ